MNLLMTVKSYFNNEFRSRLQPTIQKQLESQYLDVGVDVQPGLSPVYVSLHNSIRYVLTETERVLPDCDLVGIPDNGSLQTPNVYSR